MPKPRHGLTPQRMRFVAAYHRGLDAQNAAIEAGYAPTAAHVTGSRLIRDPRIREELDIRRRAAAEAAGIDSAWVLRKLVELAEVDPLEMFTDSGALKPLSEMPLAARKMISGLDVETRYTEDGERIDTRKVRFISRLKLLEAVGKHAHVGAFATDAAKAPVMVVIRDYTGREPPRPVDVQVLPAEAGA